MVIYMIKNLTEAESAIMKKIWELNSPVTSSVLMGYFSEERGWKSQTVSTFLSRLVKKGFLSVKRCGAANEYTAVGSVRGDVIDACFYFRSCVICSSRYYYAAF